MVERYTFDKQSVKRIGDAVRKVERDPFGDPPRPGKQKYFDDISYWDMFEFEYAGATSVRVHAGYWVRNATGHDHWVPLTIDSGTSGDPDDYITMTGITTTRDLFAKITKAASDSDNEANSLDPDTMEIVSDTAPVNDDYHIYCYIGTVVCVGGVITDIRNKHTGLIRDHFAILDNQSLNYALDYESQIFGFDVATASGDTMVSGDLILYKDFTSEYVEYADQDMMGAWIEDWKKSS